MDSNKPPGRTLAALLRALSMARRRDLSIGAAIMLFGACAELLTISSLLTFLQLLSQPSVGGKLSGAASLLDFAEAVPAGNPVVLAALLLVFAVVLAAAARLFILWTVQRIVLRLGHELSVTIFSRMLRQPYSFYTSRNPSELFASAEKVQMVVFGVLLPLIQGLVATVIAFAIVALLLTLDSSTALTAALALGLVYALVTFATRRRLRRNSTIIAEAATARMKAIQEGLGGIRDILIGQTQANFEQHYRQVDLRYRVAQTANIFISAAPRHVVEAAGVVILGLIAWFLSLQAGGLAAAIPMLGALALGAQRLLPLIQQAYVGWSQFAGSAELLRDVLELVQAPILGEAPLGRQQDLSFSHEIVLERVALSYPERPNALQDINLRIVKGQRVGITGSSGSGKSSLLDVLTGLLEPSSGEVRVDGSTITDANRGCWQRHIAHVPQSVYLPDSSISECIAFGDKQDEIDLQRVRQSAERARLHDFIISLPSGYATQVGERGVRLSGGQRQRIAIARALYKGASLIILDEATGALDVQNEVEIMNSLEALGREVTLLVVSHRLSALGGCDVIIHLNAGAVTSIDEVKSVPRRDHFGTDQRDGLS